MPYAVSIAYFDTTFHRTIPPHIYSYAINQDIASKRGLRKYGFHGLSCVLLYCISQSSTNLATHIDAYILREVSRFLDKASRTCDGCCLD